MKKLIIISLILFASSSLAYSDPYYEPDFNSCVYDTSYNNALFEKLDKEYDKKCHRQISATEGVDICGVDSYYQMVMKPYARQKQNFDFETCQPISD